MLSFEPFLYYLKGIYAFDSLLSLCLVSKDFYREVQKIKLIIACSNEAYYIKYRPLNAQFILRYQVTGNLLNYKNIIGLALISGNKSISLLVHLKYLTLLRCDSFIDISLLTNLTSLKLRYNRGIKSISTLTSLTKLDLLGNELIDDLSTLTKLRSLNLSFDNKANSIDNLTNLTSLELYNSNGIKSISTLTSLTYLDLRYNVSIDSIDALTNLKHLEITSNNPYKESFKLRSLIISEQKI
jgi:Leucine-rich repeat (LRR) protein